VPHSGRGPGLVEFEPIRVLPLQLVDAVEELLEDGAGLLEGVRGRRKLSCGTSSARRMKLRRVRSSSTRRRNVPHSGRGPGLLQLVDAVEELLEDGAGLLEGVRGRRKLARDRSEVEFNETLLRHLVRETYEASTGSFLFNSEKERAALGSGRSARCGTRL
jgi:hypothetical protein